MRNMMYKAIKYISPISVWIDKRFIWKTKFLKKVPDSSLIMDKVKEYILSIDKTRTKEQLDMDLKGVDIRLFESYGTSFDASKGFSTPMYDEIFIHKNVYDRGDIPYDLIVHETIHRLQNLGLKQKKYLGLIEGATESYTHLAMGIKKSSKYRKELLNVPSESSYNHSEAIFNTLKLILDEETMMNFALRGDLKFVKQFEKIYGKELMEKIINFTNESAITEYLDTDKENKDFKTLQNEILNIAFEKKFYTLKEPNEFITYFKDLNEFQNYRYRNIDTGDKILQEFYNTKLEKAKKILQEYGKDPSVLDNCIYKDAEFYPYTDKEEIEKNGKNKVLEYIYNNGVTNIQIEEIKKYGFDYGDNYCVMYVIQDKPIFFQCGNLHYYSEYSEENFILKKVDRQKIFKGDKVSIVQENGDFITDFTNFSKRSNFKDKVNLQEMPLNITEEEMQNVIYEYQKDLMKERYSGFRGVFRKIKDKTIFKKMLPQGIPEHKKEVTKSTTWRNDIIVQNTNNHSSSRREENENIEFNIEER